MKKMLTLLLTGILVCTQLLADELQAITPEQLLDLQQNHHALIIDVRTEAEWQATGIISDSRKLQSFDSQGQFDQVKWLADLEKLKASPEQPVVLVCRSGNRSDKVGAFLTQQLGMKNVYHLQNGLQSWIQSGHPISPNCLTIACK
jgi:rhodanese-related sulfurtransferase